jgi:non-ribosomal peptide synthetase component F
MPFDRLVEALKPEREMDRGPLFQVKMVLQNTPMPELNLPGMTLHPVEIDTGTSKFDLLMNLMDGEQGLSGSLEYDTDLFDSTWIALMLELFNLLLCEIVKQPEARLGALLEVLAEAERAQRSSQERKSKESRRQRLKSVTRKTVSILTEEPELS